MRKGKTMKKIRIKVIENCNGRSWWYGICEGRRQLITSLTYEYKCNAVRGAKAFAKRLLQQRIDIPYDPEIIKQHGC